ncbi:gamma-glutamylcyclotransferase family protein [Nocardia sp. NPDC059177]|uniref:gamma-glutamylcyclotransferase family protein n=1 Tax=Nocardia sp. NPDC059177 TaxID=3346759 RepID=UPI0036A7697D
MVLYFAYGSNMSAAQMRRRCPGATLRGIGTLERFRLAFNRTGSYRPGAVASVEPSAEPSSQVIGLVWEMSDHDLREMDAIEDPEAYLRIAVPVRTMEHGIEYCWAYISYPDERGSAPDREYVQILIDGALEAQLPPDYISELKAWLSPAGDSELATSRP